MIAVSSSEYAAQLAGEIPQMEQVVAGTWTLPLAIPPGHMPHTLSYLIEDSEGRVHLIDPGWDLDENLDSVGSALEQIGRGWADVASVIVTHLHPDHMGLARRIRAQYGVPVVMHHAEQAAQQTLAMLEAGADYARGELERWGVPAERFDEVLGYATRAPRVVLDADDVVDDGELLRIPGRSIRVIHTPGHTPGHICLHDEVFELVFTGDHVLPTVVPGIGLGGPVDYNPLERYLHGLAAMKRYETCEVLPGHGFRFRGVSERATDIALRHLTRTAEVAELLAQSEGEWTAWDAAGQLTWSRGWENLTRHYLLGALRQTELHVRLVSLDRHSALLEDWNVSPSSTNRVVS